LERDEDELGVGDHCIAQEEVAHPRG
jgi:hypothetical protein